MSCDCPATPSLSGSLTANLIKAAPETIELVASWCAQIDEGGELLFSSWSASPADGDSPIALANETLGETDTRATVGDGDPGTLYKVTNEVMLKRTATGPTETVLYVFWIWVTSEGASCGEA